MLDYVALEMRMAELMAVQQRSGFRFDKKRAEEVRIELQQEFDDLHSQLIKKFPYVPGKIFTPKRADKSKGFVAGAPLTRLEPFKPTSRQNIAWVLQQFRNARFTKVTKTGKPQVNEASLSEIQDHALQIGNQMLHKDCEMFIRLLTLQKWLGQLSEGDNSWINMIEWDGCIHHSCMLATQTGRNVHRGPNLGQTNKESWARKLFVPHPGHVMVGCDLDGLELRCLGGYLYRFDGGEFANGLLNGDIHQINADKISTPEVPVSRDLVKSLTYAFTYGSGDVRLGHIAKPEYSDAAKKELGQEFRRKLIEVIPGLNRLNEAVKDRVREYGYLKGLDGRPIYCRAEYSGLNFLLQSAGAILSKRWCVISQEMIDEAGLVYDIDYTRCAYVHDEQQFSVVPSEAERVAKILVDAAPKAGQYYNFKVPITAKSDIGQSWADTH
tara:strand:- start:3229 stop:4545 length:1317 start_codon:yes stop_codon:yes gene_type:complete